MRTTARLCLLLATLAGPAVAPAFAEDKPPPGSPQAERFPQPVRAGDLVGRNLLQPIESQPKLGRVAAVLRGADGPALLIDAGGLLGVGARPVIVPVKDVALLGEHVALMDLTPEQLKQLPTAAGASDRLPPDTTIKVGIVRPFH